MIEYILSNSIFKMVYNKKVIHFLFKMHEMIRKLYAWYFNRSNLFVARNQKNIFYVITQNKFLTVDIIR